MGSLKLSQQCGWPSLYILLFIFEYQTADIPHILLEMNAPSNNIGKNNEKK